MAFYRRAFWHYIITMTANVINVTVIFCSVSHIWVYVGHSIFATHLTSINNTHYNINQAYIDSHSVQIAMPFIARQSPTNNIHITMPTDKLTSHRRQKLIPLHLFWRVRKNSARNRSVDKCRRVNFLSSMCIQLWVQNSALTSIAFWRSQDTSQKCNSSSPGLNRSIVLITQRIEQNPDV